MKFLSIIFFCLLSAVSFSQNEHKGIILDHETKEPLEFVNVYNQNDNTVSNADGRFAFSSTIDSVNFYRVGFDKLETVLTQLKDTIFLKKSVLELNEVIVTNAKTLWQKLNDSTIKNNSFKPYKEKFLLRAVAKKDGSIWRIQVVQGKLQRKTLFYAENFKQSKKDYEVEIINMRKIGAVSDENNAYLKFPSFNHIFKDFISIWIKDSVFNKKESYFDQGRKIKLEFSSKSKDTLRKTTGYYIVDASNYAVESYYIKTIFTNLPYKKNWFLRYRDTYFEKFVVFKKHHVNHKYYISSAKSTNRIETTDEEKSFNVVYELSSILTTSDNFGDFEIKKNVSAKKDLFKIKYPYNSNYWVSQNQLLLTDEMQNFIKEMGKENTEFKVRSNMD